MSEILNELIEYVLLNGAKAFTAAVQRENYLYWPFLLSSLIVAALMWRWLNGSAQRSWRDFGKEYLGSQLWWHPSARADYWIYLANALLLPAIFALVIVEQRQLV